MSYHGSSVIGCGDGPEPLLSCCVPAGREEDAEDCHQHVQAQSEALHSHGSFDLSITDPIIDHTHQICSLIFFPSSSMVLILKSIPETGHKLLHTDLQRHHQDRHNMFSSTAGNNRSISP